MFRRNKPNEPLVSDPSSEPSLIGPGMFATANGDSVSKLCNASLPNPPAGSSSGPPPPVLSAFASQHQQYVKSRGKGNSLVGSKPVVKRSQLLWILLSIPIVTAALFMGTGVYLLRPDARDASRDGDGVRRLPSDGIRQSQRLEDSKKEEPPSHVTTTESPASSSSTRVKIDYTARSRTETIRYHIIFSTSCIVYQDWQSYTFFYQAVASGQTGNITRIVSGCKDKAEEDNVRAVFEREIVPMAEPAGRLRIHFTPDYSHIMDGERYAYFNKPFGLLHWLENELGFPKPASMTDDPDRDDTVVVLCDPDQLILRPFPADNDFGNSNWLFPLPDKPIRNDVTHGFPMGQLYGFGVQWKRLNISAIASANELPSPVDLLSDEYADNGYSVRACVLHLVTIYFFLEFFSLWHFDLIALDY
jgi:hypothetical protein